MDARLTFLLAALLSSLSIPNLAADRSSEGKAGAGVSADATFERDRFEEALNLIHSFGARNRERRIAELLGAIQARNPDSAYLFATRAQMEYLDYRNDAGATAEEVIALSQRAIQLGPAIADSYAVNARGLPLVHQAMRFDDPNRLPMVKPLLEAGADPSLPDDGGANLLVVAAGRLSAPAVELLLTRYHLDPNSKDGEGQTALAHMLKTMGAPRQPCMALLLAAGATPWVKMGGADAMEMLETYEVSTQAMHPDRAEVAAMLREARTRVPKPADFEEWQAPGNTSNR